MLRDSRVIGIRGVLGAPRGVRVSGVGTIGGVGAVRGVGFRSPLGGWQGV